VIFVDATERPTTMLSVYTWCKQLQNKTLFAGKRVNVSKGSPTKQCNVWGKPFRISHENELTNIGMSAVWRRKLCGVFYQSICFWKFTRWS